MSFILIEQFLDKLSKNAPQDQSAYLKHCNDVWRQLSSDTTFLVFPSMVEKAIHATDFLALSVAARNGLHETLNEIKKDFDIGQLLGPALPVWQSRVIAYPLLARSIRQAVADLRLTETEVAKLVVIESDLSKLKLDCEKTVDLDPAAKDAIRVITELFDDAITNIRANGLVEFAIDRFFLFGRIKLILDGSNSNLISFHPAVEALGGKLWAFASSANTAADIGIKLLGVLG
jgi:hypothetical protein